LEVGERRLVGEAAREQRLAIPDGRKAAHQSYAERGERVEVERAAIGIARELKRGHIAGAIQILDLFVALVEYSGGIHPPLNVAPSVSARHADVLADRKCHRAA